MMVRNSPLLLCEALRSTSRSATENGTEKIHDNLSQKTLKTKADYRDRIELLHNRVNLLKGKDKLLMTMYLDNSNSFRQMGRLAGMDETSISRRINGIIERLIDGKYIACLRNRDKLTANEMIIAKEYFLLGLSIRKIAAKRQWTYHRTRQIIKKIQQHILAMKTQSHKEDQKKETAENKK